MSESTRKALRIICIVVAVIGLVCIVISIFDEGRIFLTAGMGLNVAAQIVNYVLLRRGKENDK